MEYTDSDQVRKARNASECINNPAYQSAMTLLKTQIVDQWKDCPVRDIEGQRLLLQLAKLAEKFDGILAGYVQAGKLAQHRIDLDSERNESMGAKILRHSFSR